MTHFIASLEFYDVVEIGIESPVEFEGWLRYGWGKEQPFSYFLKYQGKIIFEGSDYFPSRLMMPYEILGDLIGWLTLKPEDTDIELVDDYTAEQLDWVHSGEAASLESLGYDLGLGEFDPADWTDGETEIVITTV